MQRIGVRNGLSATSLAPLVSLSVAPCSLSVTLC